MGAGILPRLLFIRSCCLLAGRMGFVLEGSSPVPDGTRRTAALAKHAHGHELHGTLGVVSVTLRGVNYTQPWSHSTLPRCVDFAATPCATPRGAGVFSCCAARWLCWPLLPWHRGRACHRGLIQWSVVCRGGRVEVLVVRECLCPPKNVNLDSVSFCAPKLRRLRAAAPASSRACGPRIAMFSG